MDNKKMSWETEFGDCFITEKSIDWIMDNVKTSQYTQDRCYIYNKAFARWFDNNSAYRSHDKLGGNLSDAHMIDNAKQMKAFETRTGALSPTGVRQENKTHFDLIREWANDRGLYDDGDPKTQALKLVEEVGETCKAILNGDHDETIDGIGDCVVVLTNLAELIDCPIEDCIEIAYNEISNRTGKMVNGTFKKD